MRPVPPIAVDQFGVFSTAQALAAGWTSHALRHGVRTERIERVRPGVYAEPWTPTGVAHADQVARVRRAAAAAAVANPRLPISHDAAGCLLGLDLAAPPIRTCATVRRGSIGDIAGVHLHRVEKDQHVGRVWRIRILTPARTVLDIARERGVDAGVAAGDSALRTALATHSELQRALDVVGGWPGGRRAAKVLDLIDGRAESVLESLSRLRIAEADLPRPELQVSICRRNGTWIARVDFYWDEFGVVGEADGLFKYKQFASRLVSEKLKQEELENTGLIVVRWGWDATRNFDPVAMRLRAAFARGSRVDRAPRLWTARPWYPASAAS